MKKLLVLFFLFVATSASAQIVNIPDPNFKQFLLDYFIDTNQDGEIQVSEAEAVTEISIYSPLPVADLTGIEAFTNLQKLTFSHGYFPTLINLSLPRLKRLMLQGMIQNPVTSFNLQGCDSLKYVSAGEPDMSYVNLLDVTGLQQLDTIQVNGYIRNLQAGYSSLKVICPGIAYCDIYDVLNVTGCTSLHLISLTGIQVPLLDLSTCTSGVLVAASGMGGILFLNTKNGAQDSIHLFQPVGNSPGFPNPIVYICADSFEVNAVPQWLSHNSPSTTIFSANTYCSPGPGGDHNTIRGTIKADFYNNGCDVSDPGIKNVPVRLIDNNGNNIVNYTEYTGGYTHYAPIGNYSITPNFANTYFSISPATATGNFSTTTLADTIDFCVSPVGVHNDLEIAAFPLGWFRPGFPVEYLLVCKNVGNTLLSGSIIFNFDNTKLSFVSADVPVSLQSNGQLTWNYSNFEPFQSRGIRVLFNLLAPPVNNVGDTLHALATIDPVNNDETAANNSSVLNTVITGSFDPNNKQCTDGHKIDVSELNKNLHYIVHFQNMGTDTAFNVVVADTLTNNVDWESFDFITSSHPCHVTRRNNKLEFYFENIKLPYKAINDAGSNGFVAFEVKPKNTLVAGDSINNTASIYFDFNLPVQTNKASTVISLLAPVPVRLEYFSLNSKDENNLLTWKVATYDLTTTFGIERSSDGIHFSNLTNITATAQRCQLPFNFTDNKPLNGKNYYRIKITDANRISFYSKILVTGKTKSGFELNAIVSDQNNTTLYVNVSKDQTVQMKIIAADGRVIYAQNKMITAGTNTLNVQTGNLSKGIYTLIVYTNDGEMITKRFLK